MKPFIQFPYEPHDHKAEDKQIRDWRDIHDPNDPQLTAWTVFTLILSVIMAIVGVVAILYLICQIEVVSDFLRDLDGIVGLWTSFILACIAGFLIVRNARKQFKK
jgi:hypothetical protein